jgi:integrin alpha FG-GAP repeat containing protein 1
MTRLLGYALLALPLLEPAAAFWPFKPKRFAAETLIDAGPLGLEGVKGRVVAVGDWNGDQKCVGTFEFY